MPWRQFKEGFKRGFQKVSNFFYQKKETHTFSKVKSLEEFERQLKTHNQKMGYDQPKKKLPNQQVLENKAAQIATKELEIEVAKGIQRGNYRNAQVQAKVVQSYKDKAPQEVRVGKEKTAVVKDIANNPVILSRYRGMSLNELRNLQMELINERDLLKKEMSKRLNPAERNKIMSRWKKVMEQAQEISPAIQALYRAQKPKNA